jgi:hypothetical protein
MAADRPDRKTSLYDVAYVAAMLGLVILLCAVVVAVKVAVRW